MMINTNYIHGVICKHKKLLFSLQIFKMIILRLKIEHSLSDDNIFLIIWIFFTNVHYKSYAKLPD